MPGPSVTLLLASALLLVSSKAGPLPLPTNVTLTSTDQAAEETCAEKTCEVRAGCKALHRPDACCPAYQCECEQDGRMYLNGEKLVDPGDPCRVCYCQGGEVVCRRIACFRRDDCRPRTVPGRCCPEYDNCPLTGESTMLASAEEATSSVPPPPPPPRALPGREVAKQEITIKEITPVSEIPAIIMDNAKEVSASSRAPLIVREATTVTPVTVTVVSQTAKSDLPETHPTPVTSSDAAPATHQLITSEATTEIKSTFSSPTGLITSQPPAAAMEVTRPVLEEEEALLDHNPAFPPLPDDLSVSPSHDDELLPDQVTDTEPAAVTVIVNHQTTDTDSQRGIVTESLNESILETDPSTVTQVVAVSEHLLSTQAVNFPTVAPPAPTPTPSNSEGTTSTGTSTKTEFTPTTAPTTTIRAAIVEQSTKLIAKNTIQEQARTNTTHANMKASPMLNLRSAIPTEILNTPSLVQEEINGELDDIIEPTTSLASPSSPTSNSDVKIHAEEAKVSTEIVKISSTASTTVAQEQNISSTESSLPLNSEINKTVIPDTEQPDVGLSSTIRPESATISTFPPSPSTAASHEAIVDQRTLGSLSFSATLLMITEPSHDEIESRQASTMSTKVATTSEAPTPLSPLTLHVSTTSLPDRTTRTPASTELSSLPVETSDQNPRDTSENIVKEVKTVSADLTDETTEFKAPVSEMVTVSKEATSKMGTPSIENVETTEFIANGINWIDTDSATDVAEEEVAPAKPSAADGAGAGVLSELIDLVGDVAAIGEQEQTVPVAEELLPMNVGYKSRHRPNANSITEPPAKGRVPTEIEEEGPVLLDALPPARHEPTTKRATIDDDGARPPVPSAAPSGDIEIITRSYVPTFSRRPTKVVQASSVEPSAVDATAAFAADPTR